MKWPINDYDQGSRLYRKEEIGGRYGHLDSMTGRTARLLYSSSKPDFKPVVDTVTREASAAGVQLEVVDAERLGSLEQDRFLNDIRSIPPQTRGQVRSGKGRTLPISGSSKLNLSIPILIFYEGDRAVDVFPKDMYDLSAAFRTPSTSDVLGVESSIVTVLSAKPELLGPGLQLVHREYVTASGVVDLIFKDPKGVFLAIEVKEESDQETMGQVLKQSNGLKAKLGQSSFRKAIVALRTSGNVSAACKDAGIELYLVTLDRQA